MANKNQTLGEFIIENQMLRTKVEIIQILQIRINFHSSKTLRGTVRSVGSHHTTKRKSLRSTNNDQRHQYHGLCQVRFPGITSGFLLLILLITCQMINLRFDKK